MRGGPVCARHPAATAAEVCKRCGNFMCGACATTFRDGVRYCPDCIAVFTGGGLAGSVPWESERASVGMLAAWWKTAKACMFGPDNFFREMSSVGGLEQALGFNVLGVTVFGLIGQTLTMLLFAILGTAVGGANQGLAFAVQAPIQLVCMAVFVPIAAAISLFVGAAIYHVIALICGANGTFETTFRILGYGMGSTSVLNVVPYLGPMVAFFWNIAIVYYGFLHCHRMSSGRALMVALFPLLFTLCCLGVVGVVFGGALIAAIQNGGGGF
jgi:hypothetical protein